MLQTTVEEQKRPTTEIVRLFPLQGEWTEADYFNLPDTNHFVELSEGRLIIPDMPNTQHQRTAGKLFRAMADFVDNHALGEVEYAPLPIRLWQGKVREPDIVFMSKAHTDRIGKEYWGVLDLVVEVISRSTEHTDRVEKFAEYAQAGVMEYWIVDPTKQTIEVFALDQGKYILVGKWGVGGIARSNMLEGFGVAVESIMS